MARLKLGVLISGRGSNLQSLIGACADPAFPAEIALVVSNVPGVQGLARAENAGIPAIAIDHRDFDGRGPFEEKLTEALEGAGVELVCLAGFMRLLTDTFVQRWDDRVVNIHPSLLPAFKGIHVHEKIVEAGVRFSGCTVHFVRPAMDSGPIIVQAVVPVHGDDSPDALAQRVLEQEHKIYPLAVRLIAEGRVAIVDERVRIEGWGPPRGALINPSRDGV